VPLLFAELVATSAAVASVSGRLEKIDRIATLLSRLSSDEALIAVAFLGGSTRQGRLGIGGASIREARLAPPVQEATLTLLDVDARFERLGTMSGPGSARARKDALGALFGSATEAEQDFLTRLLFSELRQGAQEGVLIDAVARAAHVPSKSLRRGVMMAGDLATVAAAVLSNGEAGLSEFRVRLFTPVQPMLADSAEDVQAAVAQLDDAAVEYKLDGARIQVHKDGDAVKVYSRALRDVTTSVPEVVEQVRALPARSLILDGEVLALRSDGSPWPFQDTMRRFGRRLDVEGMRRDLPLHSFFFDVLALDDRELIDEPQADRFRALESSLPSSIVIPHATSPSPAAAQGFLDSALARGHEGVMVKLRSSSYAAGSRGSAWLKVKAVRTLDLVVLAAEWGNGRRQGWLSNLHLGARDPEHGGFVMLGKTFKGLTDELLAWQTEQFLARELTRDTYTVYVRPELVVEIAFNDVQVSPHYPGGLALRFARVKRYRQDKTADQADTIDAVREIYRQLTHN
jgi:DNA ligase-1